MRLKRNISSVILSSLFLVNANALEGPITLPWVTGPLLAPAGHIVPVGHTNWEPYVFVNDTIGHYGANWHVQHMPSLISTTPELVLSQGLSEYFDLQGVLPYIFNTEKNQYYSTVGDVQIIVGFQALEAAEQWWRPDLRVTLGETVPSGNFQLLNPAKLGTDITGSGSYETTLAANFQKSLRLGKRFLISRLSLSYTWPSNVRVSGFNAYGGGVGTLGVVSPGNIFSVDLGFEYTLTQHWVPALDITYTNADQNTFTGTRGFKQPGVLASNTRGESQVYTLAPAIEYNFTQALGVIAGAWFTVKGRNSADFTAAVFALNYYT